MNESRRNSSAQSPESLALIALLRGAFSGKQMALRQRLIDGESPTDMAEEQGLDTGEAGAEVQAWEAAGERILTWVDDEYPAQMRDVHDFPPAVFVRGEALVRDRGVCVVGSREAGERELQAARTVSELLVGRGITVVSGLAMGVDGMAHRTALELGGRTVAVVGTGIDRHYPAAHRDLQYEIEQRGMVLSQFWPGTAGGKHTFPMRNAVMSAYGQATIILAAVEESGTRHQAKQAVAHGRPLVLARHVATGTTWGRHLVENSPMVRVAGSPEEAVRHALDMADELNAALV